MSFFLLYFNEENLALLFYDPTFSLQKAEREFLEVWNTVPGDGRMEGSAVHTLPF